MKETKNVCNGTQKPIVLSFTPGFDATPGTLKAKLNVRGNEMMDQLSKDLDFPFKRNGSLVVCTKDQDPALLDELLEKGKKNGVPDLCILDRDELTRWSQILLMMLSKHFSLLPVAIVCPFHLTMAFAENAADNGVEFFLNTEVTDITKSDDHYLIKTDKDTIEAKVVVNAAGVYADKFNNMVSEHKLQIIARRGQYMLLDKSAGKPCQPHHLPVA